MNARRLFAVYVSAAIENEENVRRNQEAGNRFALNGHYCYLKFIMLLRCAVIKTK
jgi:hypothetical protein